MNLTLRYRNGKSHYRSQARLLWEPELAQMRQNHYDRLLLPSLIAWLGAGAAFSVSLILFCIIVVIYGTYLGQHLPYRRVYEGLLEAVSNEKPSREITLEVNDDGILETEGQIESFCPWQSVMSWQEFEEILFLRLKNNLWAIIPRDEVQEEESYNKLRDILERREITRE